ncbi:bifunctional fructose-bisphosphatase/inositol-phosphate phosphatase [Thermococcus alcaliphilus]|uniref:bifunctional fructose-bisphosphatase/inositol-phosphate phosphatase n=1 Tax=Thermococcus alcaliphilus TaxID=139207 RepID=UPI002090EC95|nr:bifunctional fructose-bisphosphatase/inositol-phosphate phosphatase [Thermococcus alcaliphilus]MCO6041374.1 bifunctional fructose-bisphosphatase/inositol-phosphate phosphatase [Thermococcus alcaliphilus]
MYEWNEIALNLAKDIEREVMPLFGTKKAGEFIGFSPSGDKTKLVDKVAEDIVLEYLRPLGVNVVSEEIGNIEAGSEYTIVVDPIDGSFNFIQGIPIFGFSFAVFKNEKPVYAMIYEFITKNVYEGIPREGAYLNGERIRVRHLNEKSISISFYTRGRGAELVEKVKRTRVLGAIAVELAYLARGSLDGVIDIRNYVRPTDIAAGYIIAKEAGAIITNDSGEEIKFRLDAREKLNIIAVNDKRLLELILEVI